MKPAFGVVAIMLLLSGCGPVASQSKSVAPNTTTPGSNHPVNSNVKVFFSSLSGPRVELTLKPDPLVTRDLPAPTGNPAVTVYLPTYPGAVAHGTVKGIGDLGTPMSPDLVDAEVYYQSADGQSQIQGWYTTALGKLGYVQRGSGSSWDGKVNSAYVEYMKDGLPDIDLGFISQGKSTLFKLKPKYIIQPKRPSNTILSTDIHMVTLTENNQTKTVTDPNWIAKVVADINALHVETAGIRHCPAIMGPAYPIQAKFYESQGNAIPVTFTLPCGVRDVVVNGSTSVLAGSTALDSDLKSAP